MFYTHDWPLWMALKVIEKGLEKEYDFVLIVSGDTGTGKSNLGLHLVEAWQKMRGKPINDKLIEQVNVDKQKWLEKFKDLKPLDINVFDEGASGLGSKQYMERFSKTLEMLFQVIRYKRFLTVIIVPNFFRLNKFFREDRLRGLLYVSKRGEYKFYTRKRIITLCQKNAKWSTKNMYVVPPAFRGKFPKYKGNLLNAYDDMKEEGVNKILDDVIKINSVDDPNKGRETKELEEKIIWWLRKQFVLGKIKGRDGLWNGAREKFNYPFPRDRIMKILKATTVEEYNKAKKMKF
jgi:hypothetical protein